MDISDREDFPLALLSDIKLADIAKNETTNAIVLTDAHGRVEWANELFSTLSGYTLDEVRGQVLGALVKSGLQSREFYQQLWECVNERKSWTGELLNRRKDRSLYWEQMSLYPVQSSLDGTLHWLVIKRDISQRKILERDLLAAQEHLKHLLDSMADGVFEIDIRGKLIHVNRALLIMLGYPEEQQVIGKHFHSLIQHSHADGTPFRVQDSNILSVFVNNRPCNRSDEVFWRSDKVALHVEYWVQPSVMDGVVVGVTGSFIDISKRIEMERERDKMSRQLLRQNQLLQRYRSQIEEEESTAKEFIKQFSALDKISDPLVQFMFKPADVFSGDMIAFARTPDNRLHVLLADSAGHGLTAALAVIPITQPFYQMTAKGFDIPAIAREMNQRVRNYLPLPRYVACILLSVDTEMQTIQVWNGGCPPVLVVNPEEPDSLVSFVSNNLPLGVVKPANFFPETEHLKYGSSGCKLLLCTDGVTDLFADAQKNWAGHDSLGQVARQAPADSTFEFVVEQIKSKTKKSSSHDDISFVLVHCVSESGAVSAVQQTALPDGDMQKHFQDMVIHPQHQIQWEHKISLYAEQLRHLEIVPFLMGVCSQMHEGKNDSKIFLVLSELVSNALDHGVLKLNSTLKHSADYMDEYYQERAGRMADLRAGNIDIHLSLFKGPEANIMKIYVKDSGDGFDYNSLDRTNMPEGRMRHGRGIPLLRATCNALNYIGNGSEVVAYVELPVS